MTTLDPKQLYHPQAGQITLCELDEEDVGTVYSAIINLKFTDLKSEPFWMAMSTGIVHPCKVCATDAALSVLQSMADGYAPMVQVIDEKGNLLDELDIENLPPHLDKEFDKTDSNERVLH
jgi:hypothetical protein